MSRKSRLCIEVLTILILWATLFKCSSEITVIPPSDDESMAAMMEDWNNVEAYPPIKFTPEELSYLSGLLKKSDLQDAVTKSHGRPKRAPVSLPYGEPKTTKKPKATKEIKTTKESKTTNEPKTSKEPKTTKEPKTSKYHLKSTTKSTTPIANTTSTVLTKSTTPTAITTSTVLTKSTTPAINTTSTTYTTSTTPTISTMPRVPTTSTVPIVPINSTILTTKTVPTVSKMTTTTVPVVSTKSTLPIEIIETTEQTVSSETTEATATETITTTAIPVTTAPPISRCKNRTEFRLLSLAEFKNFSDAVGELHNKIISPAVWLTAYQLFIANHRKTMAPGAHGGPCFAAWHAIYLITFEKALQEFNPTVCVPYADWRADYEMNNTCESSIYTAQYFGNDEGEVTSGFDAGWTAYPPGDCDLPTMGSKLTRHCNPDKSFRFPNLYSYDDWQGIYDKYTDYSDLCLPWNPGYELRHNTLHASKGGHLGNVSCAVNDPVFWLIHGFTDMMWNKMRKKFADPAQQLGTYPKAGANGFKDSDFPPHHRFDDTTLPLNEWTCEDGLKITSKFGINYVMLPDQCATDKDCNFTDDNPNAFYCNVGSRCATKARIGGSCEEDRECFRELKCKDEPTCSGTCSCTTD